MHGDWDTVEALEDDKDVLVVYSPDLVRRQSATLGPRAWRALVIMAATVALLASGVLHPAIAALAGTAAMVLIPVVWQHWSGGSSGHLVVAPGAGRREKEAAPTRRTLSGPPRDRPFRGGPFGRRSWPGLLRLRGGRGLIPTCDKLYNMTAALGTESAHGFIRYE